MYLTPLENKKILFRCDQNAQSGFGHFSRCLNLARHFMKENITVFFYGEYSGFAKKLLGSYDVDYKDVVSLEFKKQDLNFYKNFDFVVFDSYFLSQELLNKVTFENIKVVLIDDFCKLDYRYVHTVINFRVNADKIFNYNSLNSFLGSSYFPYKLEFENFRLSRSLNNSIKNVFVFFGGGFSQINLWKIIIRTIHEFDADIKVHTIVNDSLKKELTLFGYNCYSETYRIEDHFNQADVMVCGGGLIKYESCFCLIPTASVSITELQYEDSLILEMNEIVFNLGLYNTQEYEISIQLNLKKFLIDDKKRKELYENNKMFFKSNITEIIKKIKNGY